ncbi:hypothetical protein BC834DRAFT_892736 [Gloeopeniophorella convolvens]|nr:hypothetical protein BC834DRAFT_892736 [Gloeopeniophorella convolvens]
MTMGATFDSLPRMSRLPQIPFEGSVSGCLKVHPICPATRQKLITQLQLSFPLWVFLLTNSRGPGCMCSAGDERMELLPCVVVYRKYYGGCRREFAVGRRTAQFRSLGREWLNTCEYQLTFRSQGIDSPGCPPRCRVACGYRFYKVKPKVFINTLDGPLRISHGLTDTIWVQNFPGGALDLTA